MEHVRWAVPKESVSLRQPVAVVGFLGWNDAGEAASAAISTLIQTSGARLIATIDPESFTDFASVRPEVRLDADGKRRIDWPTVEIFEAKMPGTDVLLITGPEPSLRWRAFTETVVSLCEQLGTELVISLGALLAEVPHTRPTQVIGTSNDETVIERFDLGQSRYEGPTGIVGVLGAGFRDVGIPTASLWAAVPSYTAQVPSPFAARALMERACDMMGTPTPNLQIDHSAEEFGQQIAEMIGEDEDLAVYISRLESMSDADDEDDPADRTPPRGIDETGAATIAAEVEQFLRDRDPE